MYVKVCEVLPKGNMSLLFFLYDRLLATLDDIEDCLCAERLQLSHVCEQFCFDATIWR